jgi:hypothetical protein
VLFEATKSIKMIIYNVTLKVDKDVAEEWLQWMKEKHVPDVMDTGYFLDNQIYRVMIDEEDGITFSVQYKCSSMDDLKEYQNKYAPSLQKEHSLRYANKFVAFRTLLEEL